MENQPIENANVKIIGSSGTVTDKNGYFLIWRFRLRILINNMNYEGKTYLNIIKNI